MNNLLQHVFFMILQLTGLYQVLLTPGAYYHPWEGKHRNTTKTRGAEEGVAHFRFSYSMTTVRSDTSPRIHPGALQLTST